VEQREIEEVLMKQRTMQSDPLPSWNEGGSKRSILKFVEGVTSADGAEFVPPLDRIAVFDNDGKRFMGLVHHTDAERDWAYDRESAVGRLDEARAKRWTVVDMKRDWLVVFPWEGK
jgi:hypothetical protein